MNCSPNRSTLYEGVPLMDGAMGQEEDVVEAVLTCEGDFHDPELNSRIERFRHRLKDLLLTEKQRLQVKKVEPWNSVKVTFTIPRGAAIRLRQLAQNGNDTLRQMGVLSVQIQGDTQISLTIAGRNNESTQLLLRTPPTSQAGNSSQPLNFKGPASSIHNSEDFGSSQESNSDELARKNIVNYLRQGSVLRQNPSLFDTILGTGTPSVPVLGFGLDIPQPLDSVPGPSGSNTVFRPNNITTTALQNQALRGSHLNSNFPFTKTTGAFHPPVPRLPSSAGQSSATNSTHCIQAGNSSSGRLMGPLGPDAQSSQPSSSNAGPSTHMFQHNMNTFSPVGAVRLSPATSSTNLNSLPLHTPLSSSPTSSFMVDLPPPPPYPSTTNTSRQGKPVTSSSPLLVNLLQTDPLIAAVGLASGNPNKPMTAGDLNSSSLPKKKQRAKKAKGIKKSYLLGDNATGGRSGVYSHLFASDIDLDFSNTRVAEETVTSVALIQSRTGALPASHLPDSFLTNSLPDSKPLFSSDRPVSKSHAGNPSSDEFQSDFSRSAIGARYSSSKVSDSSGQEPFPKDLDPFSVEIAAGKIINPYTGHLEPRDCVVDNVQVRISEQNTDSQGDNFASQILAKKAEELKIVNENSVPNSSSQVLDVHVMKTAIPTHISVSTSTAAFNRSGGPSQASSDKSKSSVSIHHRNLFADGSAREANESSLSSNIYAVTTKPWQDVESHTDVSFKTSSNTLTNLSPRKLSTPLSNTIHRNFAPASVPLRGPLAGGQTVRHNMNPSQHQHAVISCSSGMRPQGSVIYSSVTMSSSLPLPVSHQSYVAHTHSHQSVAAAAASHMTAPSMQNSVSNTTSVSSSISLTSRSGSTYSSSQSPLVQVTERMKAVDTGHVPLNQHNQAASSNIDTGSIALKTNSSSLLNSLPDKHIDSQNGAGSPPDIKVSSEGDENSNHSGLITDTLPEHSGTAALLEHSGVKAENHDSGVGSSSERSDDTPSEPGDGEFRSGQTGAEIEDSSKASLQRTFNCKLESKVNSNSITVGYIVNPSDGGAQSKLNQVKDNSCVGKTSVVTSAPPSTVSDISQFYHAHVMSMDKQSGLLTGGPQTSGNISSVKMNGPSSHSNIEKMVKAMSEKQHKKTRSSPKQNNKKGFVDVPTEHVKLQAEVFEKMSKLHQFAESAKEASDVSMKPNTSDKADSPDALSQRLNPSEDRPDQLIFDMDELVNGKTIGHGSGGIESKGGSNITSMYSKRSSPVNVNMLNHIYAPGLPLPRRLTESVQRLVKPLPATETSVSYSQLRPCKSPGSGGSPRAGSGTSIQSSLRMSGVRSPGASVPKLTPSDKHSLLSGGLDLAGISSLPYAPTLTFDQTDLATPLVPCKRGSPALAADVLLQDTHCFSSIQNSPPNLLLDSKSYSGKMLSQSFPPHKSRDLKPNITHMNHGLFLSLQSNSSFIEKNISSSVHTAHHSQLSRSRTESLQSSSQDSRFNPPNRSHQDITQNNHLPSVSDTSQARLAPQQPTVAENSHSTSNSRVIENSSAYTSHSNASSPVMPVLQLGQEPPVTPTIASIMPNISSQSLSSIGSAKEISTFSIGSSVQLSGATVSTQNKRVPYSNNIAGSSGTAVNATAKSIPVSTSVSTLSSASVTPTALGKIEDLSSYSAPPRLLLSSLGVSSAPKLNKTNIPNNPSPSSSRSGSSTPQFSRNLFESVSGTLTHENISSSKLGQSTENNSVDLVGHESPHLTAYGNESMSDSFSSILVSHESKGDLMLKKQRQKSTDGGDRRAAVVISHTSKTDSSTIQTSHDLSLSSFLSTEVVNLDFSLPPQTCNALSFNIGTNKSNSFSGGAVKTSLSVSDSQQEPAGLQTSQPSTSSISSASHVTSGSSQTSDNAVETLTSSAAGKDEAASKLPSCLSISSMPSIKEPILEILASALGSTISKTSKDSPGKSFVNKRIPSGASLEFHRVGEDVTTENKMVTIQSGPHRPQDYSHRQVSVELSLSDSAAAQNSDPFNRRPVRKRKSTHSEDEIEASSVESTPAKQLHIMHSHGPAVKSTAKSSPTADSGSTIIDSHVKTDSAENKDAHVGKSHSQSKSSVVAVRGSQEKEMENNSRTSLGDSQEDSYSQRNTGKSRRTSSSENKEQSSTRESRPHRSATSSTGSSDESQSNRSSSSESKDSAHKESRFHRNTVVSGVDNKERRVHRTGTVSSAIEDKELAKDGRSSRASSVDHKENSHKDTFHKDNRSLRGTSNTHDDKDDHKESSSQRSSSADDKDKTKSGKDVSAEKEGNSDKEHSDSKLEEGQKKSHRIKRQFYAYVPEKSLDQTYFDTPILSGRTRSKNKPSDPSGQDAAPAQDEVAPATSEVEAQVHQTGGLQQAAPGKTDGSFERAGGKRPTRSVRVKDNSQDQSASKRRRVQQHR